MTATFNMRKVFAVAAGALAVTGALAARVSPALKIGLAGVAALGTALFVETSP